MRDFFNQIKIRNKILISFVLIAFALIILAIWQYRMYNYYGSNEKDNNKLLQHIALGNKLKENLTDIQFLQYDLHDITDSSAFLNMQNKWEQYNLNFKRNLSIINSSLRNYKNSTYQNDWNFIKRSNNRIEVIYDSLITINIDTSLSLVNQILKLKPQKAKVSTESQTPVVDTSKLNENDLIYSESALQEEGNENTENSSIADTSIQLNFDNIYDTGMNELIDNKNIEIAKKIEELNQKLSISVKEVSIAYQSINSLIIKNEETYYKLIQKESNILISALKRVLNQTGLLILGTLILVLLLSIWLAGKINIPLGNIQKGVEKLNRGFLEYKMPTTIEKDELGEIQNKLSFSFSQLSKLNNFAKSLAKGNYKYDFTKISNEDTLGKNLLLIRDNFHTLIEKEKIRKDKDERYAWINDGISKFNSLLRVHNNDLQELAENVLAELIKYIKAQQGGFFAKIDDENKKENFYLELIASYAFNRKKYYKRKIIRGEGLVGTVAVEGKKIYLTKLPPDYLEIRSGIGGIAPKSLLVLPLIINEKIVGVIEIASLHLLKNFEIEFIEKVSESIAASISAININEQTSFLLEQSRKQAEELGKEQSERQNIIKELQESQQSISLHEKELAEKVILIETEKKAFEHKNNELQEMLLQENNEYQKIENLFENKQKNQIKLFENSEEGIFVFNSNGEILYVNPKFSELLGKDKKNCLNINLKEILPEIETLEKDFINHYIQDGKSSIIGLKSEFLLNNGINESKKIQLKIIDTSTVEEFLFTGFLKDLSLFIKNIEEKNTLKKQAQIRETKYLSKIEQLENLLKSNNIDIPKTKDNEEKLIIDLKPLMLNHIVLDKGRMEMIAQINKSYWATLSDEMNSAQKAFNQFIKLTKDYFKTEEEIIENTNYENLKEHHRLHKKITIKLLEYKEIQKTKDTEKILKYFQNIKNSILKHFIDEDVAFKHLL